MAHDLLLVFLRLALQRSIVYSIITSIGRSVLVDLGRRHSSTFL